MHAPIRRMTVGDRIPNFLLIDQHGRRREFYQTDLAGGPILLVFLGDEEAAARQIIEALANELSGTTGSEAHVYAIGRFPGARSADIAAAAGTDLPVLADVDAALTKGLAEATGLQPPMALALDPNQRIVACSSTASGAKWLEQAVAALAPFRQQAQGSLVMAQAPVLLVPNALDDAFCRRLIDAWSEGERERNVVHRAEGSRYGDARIADDKRREDFIVPNGSALERDLVVTLLPRLAPEVSRAFAFEEDWGFEPFRIGRYGAEDAGFFRAHRDNLSPSLRHRRFAVTLNLNTGEYDGGHLRFPEHSRDCYAPPRGGAIIFACGLLHEVVPVTRGQRFTLLSFILTKKQPG